MPIAIGIAVVFSAISAAASVTTPIIANKAVEKAKTEFDGVMTEVDLALANVDTIRQALRQL